ncbi:MAG: FkbM family methyltransferase [Saprospiraceae bacterium]|nr:FkbM family methyltransferase [Saprospiraceae bacterium]
MWNFIKQSLVRRRAKRHTRTYDTFVDTFEIDGIGKILFANWTNPLVEKKVIWKEQIDFFKKFLHPGDLAIDIGGNVGHMTIPMALAVGKEGKIVTFDPNPYVFDILKKNSAINPQSTNIDPYPYAITDHPGEFFYNSSEASFNNGGISEQEKSRHGKYSLGHKVQGIELESFLDEKYSNRLDKLKLIKIDTEGYDKEIIRSILPIIRKYRPTIITECFKKNDSAARSEQYHILADNGYKLYYFSDFSTEAKTERISDAKDMMKWQHFDLYAITD